MLCVCVCVWYHHNKKKCCGNFFLLAKNKEKWKVSFPPPPPSPLDWEKIKIYRYVRLGINRPEVNIYTLRSQSRYEVNFFLHFLEFPFWILGWKIFHFLSFLLSIAVSSRKKCKKFLFTFACRHLSKSINRNFSISSRFTFACHLILKKAIWYLER
jgi:hypothetical protein